MRASHLRSNLSRVLIDIEAGTWIYGRSSSSVRALRVGMNVEDHGHWARYVRSICICRVGHRRSGASHNSSSRARRFGRHYGRSSSALRDLGIRFAASTCRHVPASSGSSMRHPSFAMPWEEAPSVRHSIAGLEWRQIVGAHLRVHGYVLPMRRAIAKRHGFSCCDETALCGQRRVCSPGLAFDPSSGHMVASTARLVAAVQGLQGPGSRPVPLRAAHDPDRPTAVVPLTLRAGTTHSMALRAACSCDDVATTRPCVRVPGVRVARLAWFDPKARSDLRSG